MQNAISVRLIFDILILFVADLQQPRARKDENEQVSIKQPSRRNIAESDVESDPVSKEPPSKFRKLHFAGEFQF